MRRRWAIAFVVVAVLVAAVAQARVGGGQSFSTGSGHSGGYSGSGSGGGDGDLIFMLIWLAIRYPALGIPLLVVFVIFVGMRFWMASYSAPRRTWDTRSPPRESMAAPTAKREASLEAIRKVDPGFSTPVLMDHLQLVHRRATEAAVTKQWDPLVPFVAPEARDRLQEMHKGVNSIAEVVLAGIRIETAKVEGASQRLVVRFLGSRLEQVDKQERRSYVEEVWVFRRAAAAKSLAPEAVRRMGCPNCGAAIETDSMGRCKVCETVITDGRLQWIAVDAAFVVPRRALTAPDSQPGPGGEETGYRVPSLVDPQLGARTRAFMGRHPDFEPSAFQGYVVDVFQGLQDAWSDGEWERARPHTTDTLFQSLRFWMEGYRREGLKNRIEAVKVERTQMVKVDLDAWYESITVRIWASARDFVVDAQGRVVGGNDKSPRKFSEYWTFVRTAGSGGAAKDAAHCPSCGAALDRVSQAGVCGYCDSKITTGDFNWVLSRIDQPEVYQG